MWQGACVARGMHGQGHVWQGGHVWHGVCMAGRLVWQGACMAGGGACMAGETAAAADGMHPTGMYSCIKNF